VKRKVYQTPNAEVVVLVVEAAIAGAESGPKPLIDGEAIYVEDFEEAENELATFDNFVF
jgi:hypothetical protein